MFEDVEFEEELGEIEDRDPYYYPDGAVYVGQWRKDNSMKRQGRGTTITAEGHIYEGYVMNNKSH